MKLAYFSPLNPQPSGISDYSEELLPHLAAGADITLFVDGFEPSNPEIRSRFTFHDYRRNPAVLQTLSDYDAVLYHMGNDHRYHAGMLTVARAHPGIIVFHDLALQDFFLGLARTSGRMELYLEEVAACHGYDATRAAAEALDRGSTPGLLARPTDFPLNGRLARGAEGIIVHSEWGRQRLIRVAPSVPVAHINMPINTNSVSPSMNGNRATDKNGKVQIANFGLITPGKGIEKALQVLSSLKPDHDFHYTLVGDTNAFFDVNALVRKYGMEDRVTITGHVRLEEFERRIAATDIALNLRERTVGETSASLCRIMAAGVPAIVLKVGAFSELPDNAVVKIDHDRHADALLYSYLRRLIEDGGLRNQIGENARSYIRENHDVKTGAARYLEFVENVVARRPRRQLLINVAEELSQMGIRPHDDALLRSVAQAVANLMPVKLGPSRSLPSNGDGKSSPRKTRSSVSDNGHYASRSPSSNGQGRTPKAAGIDYKRAAIDYLGALSEERRHHLRTKPFYNLAHKPAKYKGDGMEGDMHRHFCDFANMAMKLALPPGSRILDVGCGSGWLSEYFARLGYYVKGIDISPDLIEMARERVARVPYGVDHITQLVCVFEVHDIEAAPLREKFDAILCYDSLHHLEDEHAVMRHLAAMLPIGGQLFVLEGERPAAGSSSEQELNAVMREFKTLESPFESQYLRRLLDEHGFAIVGDYVSVNGFFEREMLEVNHLPLNTLPTNHNYLICKKICEGAAASTVPNSLNPGVLALKFSLPVPVPNRVAPGATLTVPLTIENTGDTLWLTGQTVRAGIVMPAVRILDDKGILITEFHGEPMLPRAVAPGETVKIKIEYSVPRRRGAYTMKIDLVDQHVCWFEQQGSEPLVLRFDVV